MKVVYGFVAAGLLLFGWSFGHPFHFDDALITNDSNVTNPARWANFFNPFHLRQLTFFTFYLNHLIGELEPAGFHVVNVLLHIANALLLYFLLRRFVEPWIAVAAAAVFLVHPIQTEPVLYVYQRSILLACFFSLLALIALAEKRFLFAVVLFFFAFESKESALAIPLAVALFAGRTEKPKWLRTALFAGAGALGVGTLVVLLRLDEKTVGLGAATLVHPLRYLLSQTRVVFTYLRLLVFPFPQSADYDFQNAGSVLSVLACAAMIASAFVWRRHFWAVCVLVFFILLAPTSSIIPSADAAFEHRLYLPMLAFSLLAAYLLAKLPQRTWILGALLVCLSIITVRRESVWASDISLWEDTAKHAPGKARVWFNLGGAYLGKDPAKARAALQHALELQPHFPEALYDLGLIAQQEKNWSAALSFYQRALEQDPAYWPAANNMGNTLFAMGERTRSLEFFGRTLRLNPDYWPAQYNIAIVHFMNGRYTDAAPRLRTVLDWRPDFREARYLLAASLTKSGDRAAADQELKRLGEMTAAESRYTPTMILAPNRP